MTEPPADYALDLLGDPPSETDTEAEHWEAHLAEIVDFAADELEADGLPRPDARRKAARIAIRLSREMGGARYYWPKGDRFERVVRRVQMWADFDGTVEGKNGIRALSKRYGITEVHAYRLLAKERELHRARVQPELPGIPAKSSAR